MSTMTPEARMELASERLNAWLEDYFRLEDPIETALDDLGGFVEESAQLHNERCWLHGKAKCGPCILANVGETTRAYVLVRELWEARA